MIRNKIVNNIFNYCNSLDRYYKLSNIKYNFVSLFSSELLKCLQKTLDLLVRKLNFMIRLNSGVIQNFFHIFEYMAENIY